MVVPQKAEDAAPESRLLVERCLVLLQRSHTLSSALECIEREHRHSGTARHHGEDVRHGLLHRMRLSPHEFARRVLE